MANKKIVSLQGLRGYAIIFIFISHCFPKFDMLGGLGVSIFIMLSGYLLVINNYDKQVNPLRERLLSKITKFYPLHILTLIAAVPFSVYGIIKGTNSIINEILKFIVNALMLQSWIPEKNFYFSFNAVSWYLSLNIFLVFISPYFIKILKKASKYNLFVLLFAAYAIELVIWYLFRNFETAHWIIYIFPITRSIDFLIGGLTALIVKNFSSINIYIYIYICNILLIFSLAICVGCLILSMQNLSNLFFSVCAWTLPAAAIVGTASQASSRIVKTLFENKIIVYMGNISFELFLIHQLVIRYIRFLFNIIGINENKFIVSILALLVSILSAIIYRKISAVLRRVISIKLNKGSENE